MSCSQVRGNGSQSIQAYTHINEVTQNRVGFVVRRVTVRRMWVYSILEFNQPPGILSLAIPPWVGAMRVLAMVSDTAREETASSA